MLDPPIVDVEDLRPKNTHPPAFQSTLTHLRSSTSRSKNQSLYEQEAYGEIDLKDKPIQFTPEIEAKLKSPLCNYEIPKEVVFKLAGGGGNTGGGGFRTFKSDELQALSENLDIYTFLSPDSLEKILSEDYRPGRNVFHASCAGVDI